MNSHYLRLAFLIGIISSLGIYGCASRTTSRTKEVENCDNGIDDDLDGLTDWDDVEDCPSQCDDADLDGYPSQDCGGTDCDDSSPSVNPGRNESCDNGVDDNCDGLTDEQDTQSCPKDCEDVDGDHYRDETCGGDDCDDGDETIHPNAPENCVDGLDNNCDGLTDDEDVVRCPSNCPDTDSDGFQDESCGGTDCRDGNPLIHPNAPENCSDGLDNNCDGLTDDQDAVTCSPGCQDGDSDGYQDISCGGSDCDDTEDTVYPGAAEICDDGLDNNCNGMTDMDDTTYCQCLATDPPRQCGTTDVGTCEYGTQTCVDNLWGQCTNAVYPETENCDGHDENCDGELDDGTFLPDDYDALEWIEAGFWSLPDGAFIVWDSHWARWDTMSSAVTDVGDLADLWNAFSLTGDQPPSSGIDSTILLPSGVMGMTGDSIWVAAGPTLYSYESGTSDWMSSNISTTFNFLSTLDAMTVFLPGDFPDINDAVVLVAENNAIWMLIDGGSWTGPYTPQELFCDPPGTSGPCPPGVSSMARIPGTPVGIAVEHGGITYSTPVLTDPNDGHTYYQWSTGYTSDISCAH